MVRVSEGRPSSSTKTGTATTSFLIRRVLRKVEPELTFCVHHLTFSTILVEPSCEAQLTEGGDVCMSVGSDPHCALGTELNTVQLSIFSHRFMSIAGGTHRAVGKLFGMGKNNKSKPAFLFFSPYRTDGQSSPKNLHLHQH